MRYAVLGAKGQLGRDLCPRLRGEVTALTRDEIDLARPETVRAVLRQLRPDAVCNCAAYNLVDRAENEPGVAFAANAFGARDLALVCRELDCLLVHFSTDYVFGLDEARRMPYSEADAPGPVSVYGLSKLAGEYFVRSICTKYYIVRTCGLYGVWGSGGKGGNFVETMLRFAREGKRVRVVADQTCTPTYTVDVANAAVDLVETGSYGVYHLTNSDSCTWYDFAQAIFETADVHADLTAITSAEYPAAARRPAYSVLSMDAYEQLGLKYPRSWKDALAAYLAEKKQRN
jgi:dTDP-4-dehydrorhamnose reductase